MEKKCINCKHFRKGSVGPTRKEYVWGDCLKTKERSRGAEKSNSIVNFTWADGYCEQFKPTEQRASI